MDDRLVTKLTIDEAKTLLPKIGPGMEKKVLACTEALSMGVKKAIIASGSVQNPIKMALENKNCTVIS
jgi:acetylglutamate/LysW-gamma-L-alpha-aminoadipate kinase